MQLSSNTFRIYIHSNIQMQVMCESFHTQIQVRGFYKLTLEKGCSAYTSKFSMEPSLNIYEDTPLVEEKTYLEDYMTTFETKRILDLGQDSTGKNSRTISEIVQEMDADIVEENTHSDIFDYIIIISSVAGGLLLILYLASLYNLCCPALCKLKRRRENREHAEERELQNLNPE